MAGIERCCVCGYEVIKGMVWGGCWIVHVLLRSMDNADGCMGKAAGNVSMKFMRKCTISIVEQFHPENILPPLLPAMALGVRLPSHPYAASLSPCLPGHDECIAASSFSGEYSEEMLSLLDVVCQVPKLERYALLYPERRQTPYLSS